MDVITFFETEGQTGKIRPFRPARRERTERIPRVPRAERSEMPHILESIFAFSEMPGTVSFPILFVLIISLSISITPVMQQRIGFFRLDRISLPSDTRAESAMRLMVTPEPDASLLAESTPAEIPASVSMVTYSTCTVKKGDSIGAIASRYGIRNIGTILNANTIDNVRRIKVGQTLRIPSMDGISYTIARGDSLARVSNRFSIPVNSILDANDLAAATLVAGQRLFIPGATLSTSDLRKALGELFIYPIRGRLTSIFGYRADPFTGVRTFHTGIDLAAPIGTPIKATLDGKVATTGWSNTFGNYVIISHSDGYQSLYGHMSYIGVSKGQSVIQGSIIGKVGSTGYSTGSHVHLSIYKNGKMIDPLSLLK